MIEPAITEAEYHKLRQELLASPEKIIALEEKYMGFLQNVVADAATRIYLDFSKAAALLPFWKNYPPIQRGRAPTGTSIPWSEVGETAIGANILRALVLRDPNVTFPGLPSGADIRFATPDALIHFDVKVTGPNDRADEVVASPNQISGDGVKWNDGVVNSPVSVSGDRATMIFQPELPPFYIIEQEVILCLTYFLKGVYEVEGLGHQPLTKLELISVPNGLLAFDSLQYGSRRGLFIPGKDEKNHPKKRVRVRMIPLSGIASWRRVTVWEREPPLTTLPLFDT
ncbi:MAG: BglI family type II restriction endonuclease [Chloroflexota bacterium]